MGRGSGIAFAGHPAPHRPCVPCSVAPPRTEGYPFPSNPPRTALPHPNYTVTSARLPSVAGSLGETPLVSSFGAPYVMTLTDGVAGNAVHQSHSMAGPSTASYSTRTGVGFDDTMSHSWTVRDDMVANRLSQQSGVDTHHPATRTVRAEQATRCSTPHSSFPGHATPDPPLPPAHQQQSSRSSSSSASSLPHSNTAQPHESPPPRPSPTPEPGQHNPTPSQAPPTDHPMPVSNHPVPVSNHPVPVSNHPMPVSNHPMPVSNHPMPVSNHPVPVSNHPMPVSNHPVPVSTRNLSESSSEPPSSHNRVSPWSALEALELQRRAELAKELERIDSDNAHRTQRIVDHISKTSKMSKRQFVKEISAALDSHRDRAEAIIRASQPLPAPIRCVHPTLPAASHDFTDTDSLPSGRRLLAPTPQRSNRRSRSRGRRRL